MDECEALCNRVAIMVAGKFRCIGTIQYLKSKFSSGYIISVEYSYESKTDDVDAIKQSVLEAIPSSSQKEQHLGTFEFTVPDVTLEWSFLFEKMEEVVKNNSIIRDYAVRGTTLEEIFLTFSRDPNFQPTQNFTGSETSSQQSVTTDAGNFGIGTSKGSHKEK